VARILAVDDDADILILIQNALEKDGHSVTAEPSAERAYRENLTRFDLILLDVMMPGLDGWQVLQTLRTEPRTMRIPIIVCSVFDDPELANSLGADLLLPKPTSQESLLAALRQAGLLP
jgi:CheY-like chemotaxis protein